MVRTRCIKEVDSHWLSRCKEIESHHCHPQNKKKLIKLKINNSSNICQRIKVTRQPSKLEREKRIQRIIIYQSKIYKQNPPQELLLSRKFYTVMDKLLKALCEQFWELNWTSKKEVKKNLNKKEAELVKRKLQPHWVDKMGARIYSNRHC